MRHTEENLSASESLSLITSMISVAQGKVRGSSFHFILWGWCIMLANFMMYSLIQFTNYEHPYLVWLIAIPAWIVSLAHSRNQRQSSRVITHLDRIIIWLWMSMGIAVIPICLFGNVIQWNINPVILVVAAIPTFVSGIAIKFKPLQIGGICLWVGGTLCFLVAPVNQYLIGGIAIMLGYLIPGYSLKRMNSK